MSFINEKKVLSLFSGCGGMDIGIEGDFTCLSKSINKAINKSWISEDYGDFVKLKKTGFITVFANDIRLDAKTAWLNYFSKKRKINDDLYRTESIVDLVKYHKSGNSIFPENIDLVTGGFPCQDFSLAGNREGFNSKKGHNKSNDFDTKTENRGTLYLWMKEVIGIVKPKMFIAENVKGLVSLKQAKEKIEKDFSIASGEEYIVIPARVLQAANFGVPQSRERVFFFGFKKSALKPTALLELQKEYIISDYDPYPTPTHNYSANGDNLSDFMRSRDAFIRLDEPDTTTDPSQSKYSRAKLSKGQGNNEINLDNVAPTIRSEHHGNIEYRRLELKNGGRNIDELSAGLKERRLSVRECARLQTFPDEYQFILPKTTDLVSVSASSAYKIIGNAVPCLLAYNIAMNLTAKWNKYFNDDSE
ncbi:DNA cytosine methyltransferase [Mycoplasma simbae]|uniref:DNA cytosine methyltransferase n=1 Tax=Mycoplasma simbae TaxID=36744 RepID=UPI0004983457|nr:DNA (cytosine-5-)-methyltransferase [Mycoplasma simbae]